MESVRDKTIKWTYEPTPTSRYLAVEQGGQKPRSRSATEQRHKLIGETIERLRWVFGEPKEPRRG